MKIKTFFIGGNIMLYDLYDDFFRLNREFEKMMHGTKSRKTFPEVNIYESKDKYMVLAKIPGVDKKDIQISIRDNYVLCSLFEK